MDRSRWLLVAVLGLAVLGVWGLVLWRLASSDADPRPSVIALPSLRASPTATPARVTPSPSPVVTPSPSPTAPATPEPTAQPTEAAGLDPRLLFIEFRSRLVADASEVQTLSQALVDATERQDDAATVAAAADILDFVDRERDWLAAHPPAACYAAAHAAASTMLQEYRGAADAAIAYAGANGLARLEAFGILLERADVAAEAVRVLAASVEGAACEG